MAVIGIIVFCGGDHLCGGVAAEPARAAEGSAGGRGTDGISERVEPET